MAKRKSTPQGRAKGSKNLVRNGDYITNQFGVQITKEEERRLRNAVQTVNRRRKKMEKAFQDKPIFEGMERLPESRDQLRLMGEEMDIMIRKRSTSLQGFRSRKEFQAYLRNTESAAKLDYLDWRGKIYKRNLIKAIQDNYSAFPELVKGITMKIQMMPQSKFQELIGTNRLFQIKYQYGYDQQLNKLNDMREFLGLSNPYGDFDDFEE